MRNPAREGDAPHLSVIIPMYREAKRIVPTLEDVVATLPGWDRASEVVLVDDGSPDDTVRVVQPYLTSTPRGNLLRVTLVSYPRNKGKGGAVRTGLASATGAWRLIMDADNACRVRECEKLLARAGSNPAPSLVAGSRATPDAQVETIAKRRLTGFLFRAALMTMGMNLLRDTQCGFKLYRAEVADEVVRLGTENGYAFDLEHLLIARATGLPLAEVGVAWEHKDGGQIDPVGDGVKMLRAAAKLRARRGALTRGVRKLA